MTTGLRGVDLSYWWQWSQIRHVTSVLRRGTAPNYVDDGPVRAISQAANQTNGLDWRKTRFHDFAGDPRSLKGYLEPEDVIVNSTGNGTLGRIGFYGGSVDGIPCMADGHITIVRALAGHLHPRYCFYYLSSSLFQHLIMSTLVVGATNQIELSAERLGSAPIALPPIEEQGRIADFLDIEMGRIGALASARYRMRKLLELRRERTIESALGLTNGESTKVGAVPLSYLARDVVVGIVVTPAAWYAEMEGVPALRGLNVRPGRIDPSDLVLISHEGDALHRKSRLRAGDVVVVRTGQAGAAAVVTDKYDGFNCIDLVIVRTGPHLDPNYLSYFLNSDHTRNRVSEYAVGSIQSHFNVGAMKRVPVLAIPVEEQRKVVKQLDEEIDLVDRLLGRLALQERVLVERREALITAAVTGQIDVSTARGAES